MTLRRISTTLILATLSLGGPAATGAHAQSGAAAATPAQVQLQIDALDTMNSTLGPMVLEATERAKLMQMFITEQAMDSDWKQYQASNPEQAFHGLTFEQAFETALKKQTLAPPSTPTSDDAEFLQRDLAATQTLVKKQWDRVNELHEQVGQLTAFLKKEGTNMEAYLTWADQEQKTLAQDAAAKRAADDKKEAAIKANTAHQEELRQEWDQQQYQQNQQDPNMQPNMAVGDGEHGMANPDPSIQYTDRPLNGYFGGSYYNGYADPYYDVYGYGRAGGVTNVNVDNHYNCWNRYHGPGGPGSVGTPRVGAPDAPRAEPRAEPGVRR